MDLKIHFLVLWTMNKFLPVQNQILALRFLLDLSFLVQLSK